LPFIFGAGETLGDWIAGRCAPKLPACHTLSEIVPQRYGSNANAHASTEQYEAAGGRFHLSVAQKQRTPTWARPCQNRRLDFQNNSGPS
jgi:hypothetical protein